MHTHTHTHTHKHTIKIIYTTLMIYATFLPYMEKPCKCASTILVIHKEWEVGAYSEEYGTCDLICECKRSLTHHTHTHTHARTHTHTHTHTHTQRREVSSEV